ncbi:MAG: MBL fold metallo-hydrolase [Deltaproteobacteria bacterium]|nr:MBL fold metallo-hydrolase [Deltaproteobacteria bacterium]MBW2691716.1 MBL fold metallo-hydrolase [Deltaproteobacteria bacterium]
MFRSTFLTCLCATLAGCAGSSVDLNPVSNDQMTCKEPGPGASLEIRYLGSGGHLIRRGSTAIMTAPFFSNPGLFRVGVGRISPDPDRIDAAVEKIIGNGGRLDDVQAILVGHAHYDHLMDVPHVWREYTPNAKIFGSLTAEHILRGFDIPSDRIETLNSGAASNWAAGRWVSVGDVRFMAIQSEHAPHAFGIKLYGGEIREDLSRPPRRATGYREGQTFAFLIDFLDPDGSVAFRIHYQDSASNTPLGYPPALDGDDQRSTDVAIVCAASFSQVEGYPEGVLRAVDPRYVVLGHWEDFFISQEKPPRPVPMTDVAEFVTRTERVLPENSRWVLPKPHAVLRIEQCAE